MLFFIKSDKRPCFSQSENIILPYRAQSDTFVKNSLSGTCLQKYDNYMRFQKFHIQWEYERYDFKIRLEGFYLILGMAWFNQVELTRVIQSSVSVWTDKRVYLRCICCWIEDRQPLCLPKRPNGGCGLLWGLCKHPRMLAQRGFAAHATGPSLPHPDIWSVKQRAAGEERQRGQEKQNKKKPTAGREGPQKNS